MRFSYYGGSYRRFFALIPHTCGLCWATFWLEWGYRFRLHSVRLYRCTLCQFPDPDQAGV